MATFYKSIEEKDITTTRDLLHESVPMTSSVISGTYGKTNTVHEFPNEENIKNYDHGLYQSVYDFPYVSASSNHLFDLTVGYSTASVHVHTGDPLPNTSNTQNNDKVNIYNQMAQTLVGLDHTGSIKEFRVPDGDAIREAYFIVFNRGLVKDEIKKGSLTMSLATGSSYTNVNYRTIYDYVDETYYSDSPAGDYSKLTFSNPTSLTPPEQNKPCGLIYYQAGVIVLSASMFFPYGSDSLNTNENYDNDNYLFITGSEQGNRGAEDDDVSSFRHILISGSITGSTNAIRHRINQIDFSNTTELNSTIHFCRLNYNEFNYSSNPTYISSSKIQVRHAPAAAKLTYSNELPAPSTYITTIGLYGPDNSLLAVAKLSKPVKKDPSEDITLKVRLDY